MGLDCLAQTNDVELCWYEITHWQIPPVFYVYNPFLIFKSIKYTFSVFEYSNQILFSISFSRKIFSTRLQYWIFRPGFGLVYWNWNLKTTYWVMSHICEKTFFFYISKDPYFTDEIDICCSDSRRLVRHLESLQPQLQPHNLLSWQMWISVFHVLCYLDFDSDLSPEDMRLVQYDFDDLDSVLSIEGLWTDFADSVN